MLPLVNPRIKRIWKGNTYDAKTATSMVKACKAGSHARLILACAHVARRHEYSLTRTLDMISVPPLYGRHKQIRSCFSTEVSCGARTLTDR